MTNFKGTKGKWFIVKGDIKNIGECVSIANTPISSIQRPLICTVSNVTSFNKTDKANALLISKAPEMLEMLENILEQIEDGRSYVTKEEIKQLIKESTEI